MTSLLRLKGFEVHVAYNGKQGIELVAEIDPDVVVCDISLPDMDGYTIARRLRTARPDNDLRLIALTGFVGPDTTAKVIHAGFDAFLAKPADISKLMELITSTPIK